MTKEQWKAKIVERTLRGDKPFRSVHEEKAFKLGVCRECKTGLLNIKKVYLTGDQKKAKLAVGRDKGKLVTCDCGKCQAVFAHDQLVMACPKCKSLPEGKELKTRQTMTINDGTRKPIDGTEFIYMGYVCDCGMTQIVRHYGPVSIHSL